MSTPISNANLEEPTIDYSHNSTATVDHTNVFSSSTVSELINCTPFSPS